MAMEGGRTAAGPAVTEAELRKFTTAFYSDQLGDGLLTLDKVKQIADMATGDITPIPESTLQDIVRKLDQGGGTFDFKKLLLMIADEIEVPDDLEEIKISFKAYDDNRDGKLSKEEMFNALSKIPTHSLAREEIDDIVERCDVDGDGELDLQEILTAINN